MQILQYGSKQSWGEDTYFDWYGFRLAIGTTFACDPPGVLKLPPPPNGLDTPLFIKGGGAVEKEKSIQIS